MCTVKTFSAKVGLLFLGWLLAQGSYAWEVTRDFNSGTSGIVAQRTADSFDEAASASFYSRERAYEGGSSARLTVVGGEEGFGKWGGIINFPSNLRAGDELWFQIYIFIPSDFIVRTPTNGSLKFIRFKSLTASGGNGGYIDIQIMDDSPNQSNAFRMLHEAQARWVAFGAPQSLRKGTWHRVTSYVKFDTVAKADGGTGQVKVWLNGNLVSSGETIETLGNSSDIFNALYLFTYWNGTAPQTQSLWVDNIQMANSKPSWVSDLDGDSERNDSPPRAPTLQLR